MDLADRISKLSPQQRKLVELKLKQERADIDVLHIPITREDRKDSKPFPLSFAQERLWFIDQLDPGNPAYNIVRATKLEGHLDIQALEKSINEMINRHEILRTIFIFDNQKPGQVILPQLSILLTRIDLKGLAGEKQVSEIKKIKERESLNAFDLAKGPLLRTHLLELSPHEHIFLLVIHHIISDGISAEIFIRQLIRLYQVFSQGKAPALPALSLQYADYACWQRHWFGENAAYTAFHQKQETFWLNEFSGEIPVLTLPTDYPRPVMQSFEGNIIYFELGPREQKALFELASKEKTTLFIVLLSVYTVLLSKLSGMEDIVVGTPAAGRRLSALQDMIGMFVNTLPLRNYPGADKRFGDFLAEVKTRTVKAFENQDYRYEDIVERVEVTRDTGRNPLFDAAFLLQNQEEAKLEIPGLRLSPLPYEPKTSKFDLGFEVIETADNLRFSFEYCTKLFKKETIERFSRYFRNIVSVVSADPGVTLAGIEIFGEEEKHQLLIEFNRTETAYPGDKTIGELFEEQVEKRPGFIALIFEDRRLSYKELNGRSNQLARCLRNKGVKPGSIVGIFADRSLELVVAVFSVLKAGGVYLPLDPGHPEKRINYMLKASDTEIVLTNNRLLSAGEFTLVDLNDEENDKNESSNLNVVSCAGDPAYVIYTSGTTGIPKGVVIENRSVVNFIKGMSDLIDFRTGDRMLSLTTVSFDIFGLETLVPLSRGSTVIMGGSEEQMDPGAAAAVIRRENVTLFQLTPSRLQLFLSHGGASESLKLLRYLLVGGEAFPQRLLEEIRPLVDGKIYNLYGPTETTIWSTVKDLSGEERLTIGKPIANNVIYISDKYLKPVPMGVVGEIYIGGHGVARGYLNSPELTAERFTDVHRSYRPYTFYRTGDLGRWLPDGDIECLGRLDYQVKIRGFRIELQEIENRLSSYEGIEEAVVIAKEREHAHTFLCAYCVPADKRKEPQVSELREFLLLELPDYMIPSYFVMIEHIPLTPNRKIDREALPEPDGVRPSVAAAFLVPQTDLEKKIAEYWKKVLKLDKVGIHDNFFELGGNSMNIIQLNSLLKEDLKKDIPVVAMFRHLTINSFARYITEEQRKVGLPEKEDRQVEALSRAKKIFKDALKETRRDHIGETTGRNGLEIAIIGMSGRFPGAKNLHEFWENLKNGVNSICFFTEEELLERSAIEPHLIKEDNFVKAKGIIEEVEYFDASFFDYSPMEAELLDPQVRVLHELCWEALEDGGCDPATYNGAIALYAGGSSNRSWEAAAVISGKNQVVGPWAANSMIDKDHLSTRISHKLDLKGPSVTLYTACSTGLTALDLACRALLTGQCDAALAGGVCAMHETARAGGYLYQQGLINSPDGYVRAFDAKAGGTMFSDGAGVVLLKRLDDAAADGDDIYAVVKGFAANNDGVNKSSFSGPSMEGQVEVIRDALYMAEVEPTSITYVETHGTGTEIGDPIEVEALKTAFDTDRRHYCALGSVKTNIGHLDVAAGTAGFIKTVLMLKHRQIPPSLNFETPNPMIDFENSPFFVNTQLREWKGNGHPLRAGVSSFGVGGTNVHVVLEAWSMEQGAGSENGREHQLVLLSARTETALEKMSENLVHYFKKNPLLPDAAYTLKVGRKAFEHRKMVVCRDVEEAVERLEAAETQTHYTKEEKRAVFMFPGQGSQYVDMAKGLYETEPVFRQEMDRCFEILAPIMGYDVKEILYPSFNRSDRSYKSDINQTEIAQPVIFVIEYALAKLLMAWGIRPFAMIGHSIGEYTAACLAGVFSLEDVLTVVAWRGKLMQQMPGGAMLSVSLSEMELKPLLAEEEELALAAVNGPQQCVVSGPYEAVEAFGRLLAEKGVQTRELHTSHAFHSRMMDPILKTFEEKVGEVKQNAPTIPFISNVTGLWIGLGEAGDPAYWSRHLRRPVRYSDGMKELLKEKNAVFIEVGPGRTLSTFMRRHPDKTPDHVTVNLIRHPREEEADATYLLTQIGRLWMYGVPVNWNMFYAGEKRRRLHLPTYPFQGQRYWIEGNPYKMKTSGTIPGLSPVKKPDIADWFYIPSWKPSVLAPGGKAETTAPHLWMVFAGEDDFAARLVETMGDVTVVKPGKTFVKQEEDLYYINPGSETDYERLTDALRESDRMPGNVIHLWTLGSETVEKKLDLGFYSPIYLARALVPLEQETHRQLHMTVLTNGMFRVWGEKELCPGNAVISGPVMVIPQEFPGLTCNCIDIIPPASGEGRQALINRLLKEFNRGFTDTFIAYREDFRLVRTFEPVPLGEAETPVPRLRENGVYWITGGLGGIGLVLARCLVKTPQVKLILTGRSASREHPGVKELESLGAEVMVSSVDVTDRQGMQGVVDTARERFGTINGVIHAAGVPGGGLIRLKTRDAADSVLAAKIKGTLVLNSVLQGIALDFFLLCSSINSVLPLVGQVDYHAANAFLDAFAFYKKAVDNIFTVSVNWDAWQEVGMAAAAAIEPQEEAAHPLLHQYTRRDSGEEVYTSRFRLDRQWVLNEHKTRDNKGLVPGVTYLEMARAAVKKHTGAKTVEIRDVRFFNPLLVGEDEEKDVRLVLKKEQDRFEFSIKSKPVPGEKNWAEHASGKITLAAGDREGPREYDLEEIKKRCHVKEGSAFTQHEINAQERMVIFGPRWGNVKEIKYGKNEGLALIQLPEAFSADLEQYKLHPAMMDSAAAFLQGILEDDTPYIPYSYKTVRIKGAFPPTIYSHSRLRREGASRGDFLEFDITVTDEQGNPLIEVEAFTLLRVSEDILERLKGKERSNETGNRQEDPLKNGILPAEGIEVFTRILGQDLPQVVVSTIDLQARLREIETARTLFPSAGQQQVRHSRPDIGSVYKAPVTPAQQELAAIWQELLGLEQVGIDDDFFELGGDSLKAAVMVSRIKKEWGADVSINRVFNAPTVKQLAGTLDKPGVKEDFTLEPAEKKEYYAAAPLQKRFYIVNEMESTHTTFNLPYIMDVQGSVHSEKLERAFQLLIRRHESLRTSFTTRGDQLVQVIHEAVDFHCDYLEAGEDDMPRVIEAFIRPFDLSKAPLLRAALVRLSGEKHMLLFDIHHINADGASIVVLVRDFIDLYRGRELPGLTIQYKDFIQWLDSREGRALMAKQETYWLNRFKGHIPRLALFTDYPRPAVQSFEGGRLSFVFDNTLLQQLYGLMRETGTTLYMVLLAAYNVLLAKYSGQDDIIVGSPAAAREHAELENLIGLFLNTLPMRNYPSGEKTFAAFLKEVKENTIDAYENQGYPYAELIEKLHLVKDASRGPLFDAELLVQNVGLQKVEFDGVAFMPRPYDPGVVQHDISLQAIEWEGQLHFHLDYCIKLFKKETIEGFRDFFKKVILTVIENKEIKLADIKVEHHLEEVSSTVVRSDDIQFGF